MPDSHALRRDRLRARLREVDAEAGLVTRLVNVRYLTGFTGSNAALLLPGEADGTAVLATDGRYEAQAATEVPDLERVIERDGARVLADRAARTGVRRLAFEAHEVTVEQHGFLKEAAGAAQLVALGRAVEQLRVVKDEQELTLVREACAISARALAELLETVVVGRTERSIARELENRLLTHGADGPAFDTIVAAGAHSAVPHHRPTYRPVERGDFLKIDFGARYRGYASDMTRTYVVGTEPADWQVELHDLVFAAQRAGREALAPGVAVGVVDAAARDVVARAGYAEAFPHPLGHGVGLEIHEAPLLRARPVEGSSPGGGPGEPGRVGPVGPVGPVDAADTVDTLRESTPLTVEPGVYLPGRGGVRIEDTLVVRSGEHGGPELLTTTTKELLVLG